MEKPVAVRFLPRGQLKGLPPTNYIRVSNATPVDKLVRAMASNWHDWDLPEDADFYVHFIDARIDRSTEVQEGLGEWIESLGACADLPNQLEVRDRSLKRWGSRYFPT
jgi:hypothetical protein